jgi:hypothetical protein
MSKFPEAETSIEPVRQASNRNVNDTCDCCMIIYSIYTCRVGHGTLHFLVKEFHQDLPLLMRTYRMRHSFVFQCNRYTPTGLSRLRYRHYLVGFFVVWRIRFIGPESALNAPVIQIQKSSGGGFKGCTLSFRVLWSGNYYVLSSSRTATSKDPSQNGSCILQRSEDCKSMLIYCVNYMVLSPLIDLLLACC